jgi:hypothetical protein
VPIAGPTAKETGQEVLAALENRAMGYAAIGQPRDRPLLALGLDAVPKPVIDNPEVLDLRRHDLACRPPLPALASGVRVLRRFVLIPKKLADVQPVAEDATLRLAAAADERLIIP